jgi:UDP-glucose 4-epimerase
MIDANFAGKFPRVAVVGGGGFIGSHIVDALLSDGCFVRSIDDFSSGKQANLIKAESLGKDSFESIDYDITSEGNRLHALLEDIDLVLNQAASKMNVCLINPQRDLSVNGGGTLKLLSAAAEVGCKRFVHASTGSVYGAAQIFPTNEEHPLNPVSYYGVSKLAGEKYVRLFNDSTNLNTSILRYFHVYGPRQESNDLGGVVAIFIRNILNNEPIRIFGDGEQIRSFTFVDDLVEINKTVATNDDLGGQAFNCASGIKITINQLANSVKEIMNAKDHPILFEDSRPGDIKKFDVDNSKLKTLGIRWETDFYAGLKQTVDFFQNMTNA